MPERFSGGHRGHRYRGCRCAIVRTREPYPQWKFEELRDLMELLVIGPDILCSKSDVLHTVFVENSFMDSYPGI